MSAVERDEAKPSLTPLITDTSARVVPIRVLISIAIFLFKTSVIADHMGTGGHPYFSASERYVFRERLSIPYGISMWIGALQDSIRGTIKTAHILPTATMTNPFGMYVFTYIVGHLVLQLVGAKWATHNERKLLPPAQMERDSIYMAWFWPIVGNIEWPPAKYIPVGSLNYLTDRWRTLRLR